MIKPLFDTVPSSAPPLTPTQAGRMNLIALAAQNLVNEIVSGVPRLNDQVAAVRKVREAVWTAHDGIRLEDN